MLIFYEPNTLTIKGASDGHVSMDFPYIETDEIYHSLDGLFLEREGDKVVIKIKDMEIADRIVVEKKVRKTRNKKRK